MDWRWCCVVIMALLFLPFMASSRSIVKNLPGYNGDLPFKLETGYIGVGEEEEVQLFYLFVESQSNPSADPLLLWFVGGPGCCALSAFFLENGPVVFDRNYSGNLPKLELNPNAWTQVLNVIFIDIPAGTGFSYSETQQGYYSSDNQWVEHAYTFLQKWFLDHPKFGSNPFYIGGGSYSGLITGRVVQKVYEGYKARSLPLMNIKGYVLASPIVDRYLEQNMGVKFAYHLSLIPEELYESLEANCGGDYVNIDPQNTKCVSDYEAYSELVRYIDSQQVLEPHCSTTPAVNHRILQPLLNLSAKFWCRGYDNILIDTWANDERVRKALHVREGTKEEVVRCNRSLTHTTDLKNVVEYYGNLTKANLRALIYCADLDMAVPAFSTRHWIKSLNLSTQDKWRAWFVDGQVAGYTEIYNKNLGHYLTYATVKGSGHVAHCYKPKEVYNMIDRWFEFSLI